ncbi:ubiquinol-cytochrome c reductase complex assembly factor 5 isoform X1 [Patagioenas fasciata]
MQRKNTEEKRRRTGKPGRGGSRSARSGSYRRPAFSSRGTWPTGAALPAPVMLISKRVKRLLQLVPGKRRFGVYRFLPFFFLLGGAMEWFMINVRIGKETFYDVYRRKRSERQYEARMEKNEF